MIAGNTEKMSKRERERGCFWVGFFFVFCFLFLRKERICEWFHR